MSAIFYSLWRINRHFQCGSINSVGALSIERKCFGGLSVLQGGPGQGNCWGNVQTCWCFYDWSETGLEKMCGRFTDGEAASAERVELSRGYSLSVSVWPSWHMLPLYSTYRIASTSPSKEASNPECLHTENSFVATVRKFATLHLTSLYSACTFPM